MKIASQIKTAATLCLFIIFILAASTKNGKTQTVAIGHVTAEVVESVSASSNMLMNINLPNEINNGQSMSKMNTRSVEMGEIALNSGKNLTCNVILKPAVLSDEAGNKFVLEPQIANNQEMNNPNGSQNFHLKGNATIDNDQANGLYKGSYTMVFAYN